MALERCTLRKRRTFRPLCCSSCVVMRKKKRSESAGYGAALSMAGRIQL